MNMLLSSLQDGLQAATPALQAAPAATALIDGPKNILWFGFGAFIIIFVLALYMVIHARVIAPSRRRESQRAVFEPAGSDADITFDDAEFNSCDLETDSVKPSLRHDPIDGEDEATPHGKGHTLFNDQPKVNPSPLTSEIPPKHKTRRSPFAELFSKKPKDKKIPQSAPHKFHETEEGRWANEGFTDQLAEPTPSFNAAKEPFEYSVRPNVQTDQLQNLDDDVEARRRQAELGEGDAVNYGGDEFYALQRAEELREAESERQKDNAELEQRMQSLATMERSLTQTANTLRTDTHIVQERLDLSIKERFAALSDELNARLDQAEASNTQAKHDQSLKASHSSLTEMTEYVGRELGKLHSSLADSLHHLSQRIDHINDNPIDTAGIAHQLAELKLAVGNKLIGDPERRVSLVNLVRENLPVERYSFGDPLPSGNSTDCKVKLTGDAAPLVIDANYPVGAYDHYLREKSVSRKNQKAVNEYRRIILHHIDRVSELMIVPGETANSAMLYVPSDEIMNDLQNNFPDLLESSHHARIWMVSPASLIATLQILNALAPSSSPTPHTPDPKDSEDDEVLAEIEALRKRLDEHGQSNKDSTPITSSISPPGPKANAPGNNAAIQPNKDVGDLNAPPYSLSPEEQAFERLEREEKLAESAEKCTNENAEEPTKRPPFPLR